MHHDFEYTTATDRFFDYCLWEYRPIIPFANKLRSINLLFHTFDLNGSDPCMHELVRTLQEALGTGRTVWGVKHTDGRLSWEFYFYDYRRRERDVSIERVLTAMGTPAAVEVNENLPYFMFSLDIHPELAHGTQAPKLVHMYLGNMGSSVSSGMSYALSRDATRLENFYFFFDPRIHSREITAKICCSAHVDATVLNINHILWPELFACRTIVVANKQTHDGIYFAGLTIDQFLFFLKRLHYPRAIIAFMQTNHALLDHLRFDVGFDYCMHNGRVHILKSGYYGFF